MRRLWNCLIKNAPTEFEQIQFLNWITKCKETNSGRSKVYILNENLLKLLFVNVLCDKIQMENFITLTPDIFKAWEKIFEIVNEKEDTLEIGKNSIKILKFDQLIGVDILWQILNFNTNEKVSN